MLVEQITEFKWLEPPCRTCTSQNCLFSRQSKILQDKSSSELSFTAKNIAANDVPSFLPPGTSHSQSITQNYKTLNCFGLDLY